MGKNFKLLARYIIIAFVLALIYKVTDAEYINSISKEAYMALVVSAFGALTWILKFMFETKVES